MKLKQILSFIRSFRMPGLFPIIRDFNAMLRSHFLYAAIDSGLLDVLSRPRSRAELIRKLDVKNEEILDALLKVGVAARELKIRNGQYHIAGRRSAAMTGRNGDVLSALVQAGVSYYNNAYRHAAKRMAGAPLGDDLTWAGDIIARFSKLADPLIRTFLSDIVKEKPRLHALDIGCGSGLLLKSLFDLNPAATGVGIEKDPAAARLAEKNILSWQLSRQFEIIQGDFQALLDDLPSFDLITLINVVYYFPVEERAAIFRRLKARLSDNGSLVIVMNMEGQDRDTAAANLNMANASLDGVTVLPNAATLAEQLRESGFSHINSDRLMPGSAFIGIHAR